MRSEATGDIIGIDTSSIVPRLALAWDVAGNGKQVAHVTYSHYSGRYNEAQIGGNNNVGNPDRTFGIYAGPRGQGRSFAPGFNPANYVIVDGRFPTANVSLAPGSRRRSRRNSPCRTGRKWAGAATPRPRT